MTLVPILMLIVYEWPAAHGPLRLNVCTFWVPTFFNFYHNDDYHIYDKKFGKKESKVSILYLIL